tara:strand:+ start:1878 stop:2027 length:150 start_codon:yes stop_codon:yes gene_type:complete
MKVRKKVRVEDLIKNFPKASEEVKVETNFKFITGEKGRGLLVEVQNNLN